MLVSIWVFVYVFVYACVFCVSYLMREEWVCMFTPLGGGPETYALKNELYFLW